MLVGECRGADRADISLPEAFEDFLNIFLLGETDATGLVIPSDMYAEDVGYLTQICHLVMFLKLLLVMFDHLEVLAGHGKVINVEGYDGDFAVPEAGEHGMVGFSVGIAH